MSIHNNTNGHRETSLTMVVLARTLIIITLIQRTNGLVAPATQNNNGIRITIRPTHIITLIQRTNGIVAPATNNNNGIRITIRPTHITLPMILTATLADLTPTNTRITHGKNLPLTPLTGLELLTSQTV